MKRLLITFGLVIITGLALEAQPAKGNPGISPTPIDGGISLLIAAGAALGGKKVYDNRKKRND